VALFHKTTAANRFREESAHAAAAAIYRFAVTMANPKIHPPFTCETGASDIAQQPRCIHIKNSLYHLAP
jgi:hypothetical protein